MFETFKGINVEITVKQNEKSAFLGGGLGWQGTIFDHFCVAGSRIGSEFGVWQMSVCHGPPRGLGSAKITKFALRNFVAFESMDGLKFDVI